MTHLAPKSSSTQHTKYVSLSLTYTHHNLDMNNLYFATIRKNINLCAIKCGISALNYNIG